MSSVDIKSFFPDSKICFFVKSVVYCKRKSAAVAKGGIISAADDYIYR